MSVHICSRSNQPEQHLLSSWLQESYQVEEYFTDVRPGGGWFLMRYSLILPLMRYFLGNSGDRPVGAKLKEVVDKHLRRLDSAIGSPRYRNVKPLDIIVITSGPSSAYHCNTRLLQQWLIKLIYVADSVRPIINEIGRQLRSQRHHVNFINIQFVHVGTDRRVEDTLRDYIHGEYSVSGGLS